MITAHEARLLVQTSQQLQTKRLNEVSQKIEEAAKLGKNSILLDNVILHDPFYRVEKRDYQPAQLTEPQRLLKAELESPKIGFSVKIVEQKHDGVGGLGSMDQEPQPYSTWHIQVGW